MLAGMENSSGPVLVAGATGRTGHRVVARLLAAGTPVRVLTRDAQRAREGLGSEIEIHEGDVRDPASLRGVGEGVRGAICALGTRTYLGRNGGVPVDAEGTAHLMDALAASGAPHVVLMSAFGLDRRSPFLSAFSLALGGYFTYKEAAERAVRASGLPYTIVRPMQLRNGPPRSPALLNQAAPLSLLRTVSRDTVADVLVTCLGRPEALDRTFELCEGGETDVVSQLASLAPDASRPLPPRTPLL